MIGTLRKGRKIYGLPMRMLKTQREERENWQQVSSLYCRKMIGSARTAQNEIKQMRHRRKYKLFGESRVRTGILVSS